MKYFLNYQYFPNGAARPSDDGQTCRVEVDETGFALLPNVGDFVNLNNSMGDMASFHGRVKSRLFSYVQGGDEDRDKDACMICIVVEETDDDWGLLLKE
jgi:hypothetical protein